MDEEKTCTCDAVRGYSRRWKDCFSTKSFWHYLCPALPKHPVGFALIDRDPFDCGERISSVAITTVRMCLFLMVIVETFHSPLLQLVASPVGHPKIQRRGIRRKREMKRLQV